MIGHSLNSRFYEHLAAMLVVTFIIGLGVLGNLGVEAGLSVEFEDVQIVAIDNQFFDPEKTGFYIAEDTETGETTVSSTLKLIKKLPAEIEARFTLMGLSMGKYNMPTGVDVKLLLCETLNEPILIGPFFTVLGFSEDSCPPEPGEYSQEGYKLPTESLPNEFPENKYLTVFEMSLKDKSVFKVKIYVDVKVE